MIKSKFNFFIFLLVFAANIFGAEQSNKKAVFALDFSQLKNCKGLYYEGIVLKFKNDWPSLFKIDKPLFYDLNLLKDNNVLEIHINYGRFVHFFKEIEIKINKGKKYIFHVDIIPNERPTFRYTEQDLTQEDFQY